MITDIGTVMWKEWKEILSGGSGRGKVGLLIFVGILGIFLPLQMGRAWVESPIMLAYWTWVPLFLVTSVIADSFAGERERHTLETLLASRLSDRAILFGKVGAAVGYGVAITWLSLLLGLVTANLAYGQGKLLLYPVTVGLGIIVLSLLGAGLAAGAGVLISLRAATARQAQQTLSLAIMLLLFVPTFGVQALPEGWKMRLFETFMAMDITGFVVTVMVILAMLNVGLLAAAMTRFRRAQLILD